MPILAKNSSNTIPECTSANKSIIDNRTENVNPDLAEVSRFLENYKAKIESSSDPVIRNFARATSFPISDIQRLIQNNPDCKYIRVYNGIMTTTEEFVTYCAPISDEFDTFLNQANSIISQSCCHCNPCSNDHLLNP